MDRFFFTCGRLYYIKKSKVISLKYKDKEHVEKFKRFVGSGHKIHQKKIINKQKKVYMGYKIVFRSEKIYDDLWGWGIRPKDCLLERLNLEFKNNRDFWRGVFDIKGSISAMRKTGQIHMYLEDSYDIIKNFRGFLDINNIKHGEICEARLDNLYRISISCGDYREHLYKTHNILYKNSNIYLDKKYNYFSFDDMLVNLFDRK